MINWGHAGAYLFIVGVSVLYTLFLESQGGCYLLIALGAALVLSIAVCVLTKRDLKVSTRLSGDILNKKETAVMSISFSKSGLLPSSFIRAELYSTYHFAARSSQTVKTAIFGRAERTFSVEYTARFFGKGKIGVSTVTVTDYLGLISLKLPVAGAAAAVKVYPDIPDVNERDGLARSLTDSAAFDDSEETTQSLFAASGTPGYEHRKYEPGDSLKLINWKLSAKRGELYVRKLEGTSGAEQLFVLDKAGSPIPDREKALEAQQLAVEGMLGLMRCFARSELPIKLSVRFGELWETFSLVTLGDISDLRYKLTELEFSETAVNRIPSEIKGRAVIFSARCDDRIVQLVNSADTVSAAADSIIGGLSSDRAWLIKRDGVQIKFEKA